MTLGDILKQYREKHNISMDEFSKRSSLSKGYISMLENNINPRNNKPIAPTLPTIRKIAQGMNVDTDILLKALDDNQEISLNFSDLDINETCAESTFVLDADKGESEDIDLLKQYHSLDPLGQKHVLAILEWETDRIRTLEKQKENFEQQKAFDLKNKNAAYSKLEVEDISALEKGRDLLWAQALGIDKKDIKNSGAKESTDKSKTVSHPDISALDPKDLAALEHGKIKMFKPGKNA